MPSPFDTYAAVRPFGTGSDDPGSDFFTMEDELTNDPSADILHPSDQALAEAISLNPIPVDCSFRLNSKN